MRIDANIPFDAKGPVDPSKVAAQGKPAKVQDVLAHATAAPANAQAPQDVDPQAVARVRAMLESGQLDTPQAIVDTAQAMLDKGI